MTELHRFGFATVFATDTADEVRTCRTTFLHTHIDELANAFLIEHLERVDA